MFDWWNFRPSSPLASAPSGLLLSWAPARPAAWTAAPWPDLCLWVRISCTASAAFPTAPASSASPAATFTAAPAATRSSTWPSRTSRACPTTLVPCASPSVSWGAWGRRPRAACTDPAACRRSSSRRESSTGAGGGEAPRLKALPWNHHPLSVGGGEEEVLRRGTACTSVFYWTPVCILTILTFWLLTVPKLCFFCTSNR